MTILIAGAGPTGLMLACELRLAGVEVIVLEKLEERRTESRAGGVHARTMEVLDQRGIAEKVREQGAPIPNGHFGGLPLHLGDFQTRFGYVLMVPQTVVEGVLNETATAWGADIRWSSAVTGVNQDDDRVLVDVDGPDGPYRLEADYLVGCDGGRGSVRKLAGFDFPGTPATMTGILADVVLTDPPGRTAFQRTELGDFAVFPFQDGWHRAIANRYDRPMDTTNRFGFEEFRASFREIAGTDFGMTQARWVTQYGDAARQVDRYRNGRVLLAGDAAHIHFPAGGQGLNLGVKDAVNLGWKLAAATRDPSLERLLDSYHDERHPVGARVLVNTRAQNALMKPGHAVDALRDVVTDLIGIDEVNQRLGHMITALDIRYETGCDHPLAGRRVPDVKSADGDRIHELLRSGRPMLLWSDGEAPAVTDLIDVVTAGSADTWPVPGVGRVPRPAGVLVRPDGHVAWAGDDADLAGLRRALTRWFGDRVAVA